MLKIKIAGKASQVFKLIKLLAETRGDLTLKEIK